jgi:hypothetical protein
MAAAAAGSGSSSFEGFVVEGREREGAVAGEAAGGEEVEQ